MKTQRILFASIVLAVMALAAASVTTPRGRDILAWGISQILSSPEQHVRLVGLDFDRHGTITLAQIYVEDPQGIWLHAHQITITPHWRRVLTGTMALQAISVARLQVAHLPQTSSAAHTSPSFKIPPVAVGSLILEELQLKVPVLETPLRAAIQASIQWNAPQWRTEIFLQDLEGDGVLVGQGQGTAQEASFSLQLTEGRGILHRLMGITTGPIHAELTGSGPLHAWSGHLTLRLATVAAANADLQMEGKGQLRLRAEIRAGESLPAWAQNPLQAEATLVWADGAAKIPSLTLVHPLATISAQGRMDGSQGTWNATVSIAHHKYAATWSGDLRHDAQGIAWAGHMYTQWTQNHEPICVEADGAIHVAWEGPWETSWEVAVTLPQISPGPWRGHIELTGPTLTPQGEVRLRLVEYPALAPVFSRLLGEAPSASAQWSATDNGELHLQDLHLDAPLRVQGQMQVTSQGNITTDLELLLDPQVLALAPQGARASLRGQWPHESTAILEMAHVDFGLETPASFSLRNVHAQVHWHKPKIALEVTAMAQATPLNGSAQGMYAEGELCLDAGRLDVGPNRLTCSGTWNPWTARLAGQVQVHAPDLRPVALWLGTSLGGSLTMDTVVSTQGRSLRLTTNGRGQVEGEGWTSGAMEFSATMTDSQIQGRLSLKEPQIGNFPMDTGLVTFFGPKDALTAEVRLQAQKDMVRATVRTHTGSSLQKIEVSALSGRILGLALSQETPLRLAVSPGQISWQWWKVHLDSTQISTQGRVGKTLDAQMDVQGSLAPIPGLFGLANQRLAGQVNATATVSGSRDHPRLYLEAAAHDVRYEHLQWGVLFQRGHGQVETTPNGVTFSLQGQDAHNGTARFTGKWDMEDTAHIQGQLATFTLMDTDTARVAASGTTELLWQGAGRISANLDILKAHIRLPRNLTTIPRLDVEEEPPAAETLQASKATFPLTLDLQLRTSAPATVQGHGITSAWDAQLHLSGDTIHPSMAGELRLRHGTWQFLGRRFDLTQGHIHFPEPSRAFVDLTAQATAPGIKTTARILGPADALHLDLTSIPTLPTEEILARTLFGRSLRQISPFQALRLAQTAANISNPRGLMASLGALEALEERLRSTGIDVGSDAQDNPTIGIEREVGNYHIRAERSLGGGDKTSVEVHITPNLGVRTEIGGDSRQGAGVQWSMDY